jgi:hypothetical protein
MSADRRFTLLIACALTAVLGLGAVIDRASSDADGTGAPAAAEAHGRLQSVVARTEPGRPPSPFDPLLATSIAQRFPTTSRALTHYPPLLPNSQIVSYYGSPYTPDMGLLGTADAETVAAQVEKHAAIYDRLNGPMRVVPALHFVYAVAQPLPTDNGRYLQYADAEDVERYIEVTRERGMLLFIDLQIGRSSVEAELQRVLPYLREPHVHLALDPEFALRSPDVPGSAIGSLNADDIDEAQAVLQRLVEREHLPAKLLIVHQFLDGMVRGGDAIERYPDVELIVDMDGFGPAEIKKVKYERYAARSYATHAGIKLFMQHDPDLMSEADVLALQPTPVVVIYQ